jgi:hypothetical protein
MTTAVQQQRRDRISTAEKAGGSIVPDASQIVLYALGRREDQ